MNLKSLAEKIKASQNLHGLLRNLVAFETAVKADESNDHVSTSNMTIEQFRASGKWSEDIPAAIGSEDWGEYGHRVSGKIYPGDLYIECADKIKGAPGPYVLTLGREITFGELAELEAALYAWAEREGYFEVASS